MAEQYIPKAAQEYVANVVAFIKAHTQLFSNFEDGGRLKTLIEGICIELAGTDSDYFLYWTYAIKEACYLTHEFPLQDGVRASGQVRFTHTGHGTPFVIPKFTIALFGVNFTSEDTPPSIPVGQTFVDVNVSADESGTAGNIEAEAIDTDQGKGDFEFATPIAVEPDRIHNPLAFSGGTEQETEDQREDRFRDYIQNLTRSTLSGIRAWVLKVPGVVACSVTENINPITLEAEPGWVIVSISDGTASPPPALLTEVQKVVDGDPADVANYPGLRAAGVYSHVQSILTKAITFTENLYISDQSTLTDQEAKDQCSLAQQNYVNTLGAGQDVLLQQLEAVGLYANRADFISIDITSPGTDFSVADNEIPKVGGAGGGTITVANVFRIPFP